MGVADDVSAGEDRQRSRMSSASHVHSARFSIAAALGLACGPSVDDLLEGTVAWEGEHLTYHASASIEVCEGTPAYVDGFVPFVAGELGIEAPTGLTYVWSDDPELTAAFCDLGGAKQCAKHGVAATINPALLHEVVHITASPSGLNRWPFFSEGLAVAYDPFTGDGAGGRYVQVPDEGGPLPDPRSLFTLPGEEFRQAQTSGNYITAGSFVAFLLARHGPAKYVDMVRRLGHTRSMSELREVFLDVYGVALDDEVERFIHGTECTPDAFPVRVYDCTMPAIPWEDASHWRYAGTLECESGDLVGGISPTNSARTVRARTVEIPTSGAYRLHLESDRSDVLVHLGACFGCPWEPRHVVIAAGETATIELDAGPYHLRVLGQPGEAAALSVDLTPAS